MRQGYRRDGKGLAVLRFLIGLVVIAALAALVYYAFSRDYSASVETEAPVETAAPAATLPAEIPDAEEPAATDAPAVPDAEPAGDAPVIADEGEAAPAEPTAAPTEAPTPTPEPTVAPTPTPVPTPVPTAIPAELLAEGKTKGFSVPTSQGTLISGITECYLSAADNFGVMHFTGYSYADVAGLTGGDFSTFIVITQQNTGKSIAYKTVGSAGVSGYGYEGAQISDPTGADFELFIDVSKYESAVYYIGIVTGYEKDGKSVWDYTDLSSGAWFTVNNGEVVKTSLPE